MGVYFSVSCYAEGGKVFYEGCVIAHADYLVRGKLSGWRDDLAFEQSPLYPFDPAYSFLPILKISQAKEAYVVFGKYYYNGFNRDAVVEPLGQNAKTRSITRRVGGGSIVHHCDVVVLELGEKNIICVTSPNNVATVFVTLDGVVKAIRDKTFSLIERLLENEDFQRNELVEYFSYAKFNYDGWSDVSLEPKRWRRNKKK